MSEVIVSIVDWRRKWGPTSERCNYLQCLGKNELKWGPDRRRLRLPACISFEADSVAWPNLPGVPLSAPIHKAEVRHRDR